MNEQQVTKVAKGRGFIAALDQSGGSTPKALLDYGITEDSYNSDSEMFDLMHAMRSRTVTSPAFDGEKIVGAILFEQTMDRQIEGIASAEYLWTRKQIVPFVKIDKGLAEQADGVQLMKPMPGLGALLDRANQHHVFGTKMRSVIHLADQAGIDAILDQQFEVADTVLAAGLMPIIEPEVNIKSEEKAAAEDLLRDGIAKRLGDLGPDQQVMLKLSLPTVDGFYADFVEAAGVLRVVALSGGYSRERACELLRKNPGVIASFSRALSEGLSASQTDEEFNATLQTAIDMIYDASVNKD